VNIITTLISSMLPITSVIILYFVDNIRARLGIVAAFLAVFSLTLALVTEAKRVEIFAATAGYVDPCHIVIKAIITNYAKAFQLS